MEMPYDEDKMQDTLSNAYYQNTSALQIRLDTEQMLKRIELFLRGKIETQYATEDGKIMSQVMKIGKPFANEIGVQGILRKISMIINPQIVQGNFDRERYDDYIEEVNMDLVDAIVINQYEWEVQSSDVQDIIDSIMHSIIPFMSRLIDNKERESYSTTLKTLESIGTQQQQQKKGLLNMWGNKQ